MEKSLANTGPWEVLWDKFWNYSIQTEKRGREKLRTGFFLYLTSLSPPATLSATQSLSLLVLLPVSRFCSGCSDLLQKAIPLVYFGKSAWNARKPILLRSLNSIHYCAIEEPKCIPPSAAAFCTIVYCTHPPPLSSLCSEIHFTDSPSAGQWASKCFCHFGQHCIW